MSGKVYFIGGGPGDPELLTLKAARLIESADLVVYADSLVHPSVTEFAKPEAQVVGSKTLTLTEMIDLMLQAVSDGKIVARIQSGDPSIYGAVLEQMRILEAAGVDFEIVPGVSSAFSAAAALKTEFTVPGGSQTVIFTRLEGRVEMPDGEKMADLARHGATLVIFLSITRINRLVKQLLEGAYTEETPVAIVYRVGWPDEQIIRGTLADIGPKVKEAGITLQALVLVGDAFDPNICRPDELEMVASSHLYSESYTHIYRRAKGFESGRSAAAETQGVNGSA
ncbi:MAG: precorrin-4 C(11)-methyltransferase [Chloroflexi bacterium]|nr:precorrin-4 C(11)-methyltransferase [Chloroflexota bacterium]MDA1228094.1 precorrin-4 C(11)-methyltransferase [Chloroflexota bacterium]